MNYQDDQFLTMVEEFLNYAIENDNVKDAYGLSRAVINFLTKNKKELESTPDILDFYNKILVKAEFVALPLLDNNEVVNLLRNNFIRQFEIPFYDFPAKFKNKILGITVFEDRDVFREQVRKVLLDNEEILTGGTTPPRTMEEWLRDYIAKLGLSHVDTLKRSQYFIDLGKDSKLSEKDREKLKVLFDLFEETKLSSLSPFGYDNEVPIVVNNQLCVYRRGRLEKVEKSDIDKIDLTGEGGQKKEAEKGGEIKIKKNISEEDIKRLEELKGVLAAYPEKSLQKKAVEEEIKKLEGGSKK